MTGTSTGEHSTRSAYRADALLGLTALIWGIAFVAQKAGMDHIGPFAYTGVRFALGTLVLIVWRFLRPRKAEAGNGQPSVLRYGVLVGVVLFCGATLQQVGLVYTTAGKAGFLTGLYVPLVPILGLLWGVRPPWLTWCGVGLALIGMYLLSVKGDLTIDHGDLLVCASALFFAGQVMLIGWLAPRGDPIRLATVQFATVSVLSLLVAGVVETTVLADVTAAAWPILYGGLLSVGVAYTLQVVAQQDAPPTHAAIIMSLESVFAALAGWIVLHEILGLRGIAGCLLMLCGMIVSQLAGARDALKPDAARPAG